MLFTDSLKTIPPSLIKLNLFKGVPFCSPGLARTLCQSPHHTAQLVLREFIFIASIKSPTDVSVEKF